MNILEYKGYQGTAELDLERKVCRGKILFITDLVTYEAEAIADLQREFEAAVDDYLETCAETHNHNYAISIAQPQQLIEVYAVSSEKPRIMEGLYGTS